MKPVYRQCDDKDCQAYRMDLPHSHLEEEPNIQLEIFKDRWHSITDQASDIDTLTPQRRYLPGVQLHTRRMNELPRLLDPPSVSTWLSIPLEGPHAEDLMQKIGEYITWVETGMTRDVCKCEWIKHPDPSKGMIRGGDTALDCPAHSKEGLVLGFFKWLSAKPEGLKPAAQPEKCTLGNIATVDAKWVCCQNEYPGHTPVCPERKCPEHGD